MGPACDWWIKQNGWGLLALVKHLGWFHDTLEVLRRPDSIEYLKQGNNLSDLFGFLMGETSPAQVIVAQQGQQQAQSTVPCPVCGHQIILNVPRCPSCLEDLRWE